MINFNEIAFKLKMYKNKFSYGKKCTIEGLVNINTKYSNIWPNIDEGRPEDVPKDAKDWDGVPDKLKYFSDKPG